MKRVTAQKYKDGIGAALGRNDFYLTVNTVERLDIFGGNAAYQNMIIGHNGTLDRYKGKEDELETGFSLVLPTAVYSDRETVDLGDMTLELVWFGRAGDTTA